MPEEHTQRPEPFRMDHALDYAHRAANQAVIADYLAPLAETTRCHVLKILRRTAMMAAGHDDIMRFPWIELDYHKVMAIRWACEKKGLSPQTINTTLSVLRSIARTFVRSGRAKPGHPIANVLMVPNTKADPSHRPGMALTETEIALMFVWIRDRQGSDSIRYRDAALLAVLLHGLRRQEAVDLLFDSVKEDLSRVWVVGKGKKRREVPIRTEAIPHLKAWIEARGNAPGWFFNGHTKTGTIRRDQQMNGNTVWRIVKTAAEGANIQRALKPHDLRRTFITLSLKKGMDVFQVQRAAGHSRPETTERYDRRPDEDLARAMIPLTFGMELPDPIDLHAETRNEE